MHYGQGPHAVNIDLAGFPKLGLYVGLRITLEIPVLIDKLMGMTFHASYSHADTRTNLGRWIIYEWDYTKLTARSRTSHYNTIFS